MSFLSRLRSRADKLTPAEAAVADDLLLVDVRQPEEFRAGHAPGAHPVPLDVLDGKLAELADEGRPIAFVCQSGARSAMAVRSARAAGIQARNVQGGMLAWQGAGLPVERGPAKAPKRRKPRYGG